LGGYQFVQGDFALAAGGLLGAPTLQGASQVPEFQTDFVLIAIGSRFGIAVVVATLCLLSLVVIRCLVVALRTRGELATFVGIGIALMLGIQTMLIVGGTLRLLPLTGLTVPLVSYGGTSILVTLFALGVIIGLDAQPHRSKTAIRSRDGVPGIRHAHVHKPVRQSG
jgi:cell division protein FtsW